jgi:hypothetical protein
MVLGGTDNLLSVLRSNKRGPEAVETANGSSCPFGTQTTSCLGYPDIASSCITLLRVGFVGREHDASIAKIEQ